MNGLSPLAVEAAASPPPFTASPAQPINGSIRGLASQGSPSSPALARALPEDPLAGVPTPNSEMAHSWSALFKSPSPQANTPTRIETEASKACKGVIDGNCWSMVKDLAASYSLLCPQPSQQRVTPFTYKASASMSPQPSWPGLQLSDNSPPSVEAEEALAWSPSLFLVSSPSGAAPDANHCSTPLQSTSAISQEASPSQLAASSQQDVSTDLPFELPSVCPHEQAVADGEASTRHSASTNCKDSAQTANIGYGTDVVSAPVSMSAVVQRPTTDCESVRAPKAAAVSEVAAVPKAAPAKRGCKASSRKPAVVPLQVQTRRQTATNEKHLQRMRRVSHTMQSSLALLLISRLVCTHVQVMQWNIPNCYA